MSFTVLGGRSGVALSAVRRILGGRLADPSDPRVIAVAAALGILPDGGSVPVQTMRQPQARLKAEQVARLVQGICALEDAAVDQATYQEMIELTYGEMLAGSPRRLWAR
ncbi:MAG: hypothetical protein KF912_12390 [Phycisphaeraceae bacterium]|nr:hypothetical protein [Phycisphaeraceae bacterium]MBX3368102.1 hypothetical protein [Phycisphaeraceae bacterium]